MKMTRKRIIYTLAVTLIVVFSTTFSILMTLERMDYRNYLQGEYSRNMYELINSVQNIQSNLGKAAIVGSREQSIIVFEEIFRYASMANDKLHSLPLPQEDINNTSKFLSQIGGFCYSLSLAGAEGRSMTDQEYANIDNLQNQSFQLLGELNNVLANINEGKVKWGEIRKKASGVLAKGKEENIGTQFAAIQKQIVQYPALIYDGPFSDNVLEVKPKVTDLKEVSINDAMNTVKTILGKDRVAQIENKPAEGTARIPSYSFGVSIKGRSNKEADKVTCVISKNGGKIVYLLDNRAIGEAKIKASDAAAIGSKYLEGIGYKNMEPTYTLNYGNSALISYVFKQDNITMYPDQLKLKIALDDGSIVGIESEKYLVAHTEKRDITPPKISQEEGQKRVGKRLTVNSVKLAVIPTVTNKEVLCYEFAGTYKNTNYIVYIDAYTGYEQRILQIQNTPNGELTM